MALMLSRFLMALSMWLCRAVLVTEVRSKLRACCKSHSPDCTSWACSNALQKRRKKSLKSLIMNVIRNTGNKKSIILIINGQYNTKRKLFYKYVYNPDGKNRITSNSIMVGYERGPPKKFKRSHAKAEQCSSHSNMQRLTNSADVMIQSWFCRMSRD